MKKLRSKFSFEVNPEKNRVEIIDEFSFSDPSMSVTNDAENVLTYIRSLLGDMMLDLKIIARDTDGNWDTLIPEWDGKECVHVSFRLGAV